MAFSNVKCSFRFTSRAGDTWSEAWYRGSDTLGTFTPIAVGPPVNCLDWVEKRRLCLSQAFTIKSCSITAAPLPGTAESSTRKGLRFKVPNGQGSRAVLRDVGATTANVTVFTALDASRVVPLHGIPDVDISYDVNGEPQTGLPSGVSDFFDYLTSGSWKIRAHLIPANHPDNKRIKAITVIDGVTSMTVPGLAIPANTKRVEVSGCKGWKTGQFNGIWVVGPFDALTGVLQLTTTRRIDPEIFYVANSGQIRLLNEAVIAYQNVNRYIGSIKPATHKIGNPFEGQAGRRSVKK